MSDAHEQQAEGSWKQFKGRLRESYGALTDDDVERSKGRREQLIGQIQEKTGEARETIAQKIDEMASEVSYHLRND
jgi:uncharacterized protein YjbJ (UPF0337 family)